MDILAFWSLSALGPILATIYPRADNDSTEIQYSSVEILGEAIICLENVISPQFIEIILPCVNKISSFM